MGYRRKAMSRFFTTARPYLPGKPYLLPAAKRGAWSMAAGGSPARLPWAWWT